ncbi:MAG: extracellular solute-binding protein [Litorilinea sp.]
MNNNEKPQATQDMQQRDLSRRRFLQMTGLASGAAFLAACAPAAAPSAPAAEGGESASGDTASPSAETTTISWWNQYETATTQIAIPQIIEGFQEMYPNIQVDYEITGGPPGGGDYTEVMLARIAAGNPPNAATTWDPPAQFAARGSLSQLDAFMENAEFATQDAFYEGPLNSCRWQGGVFGLPASAGAGCVVYNVDMLDAAGIPSDRASFPTTWEGLRDLSAQLTEWDGEPSQVGLVPWATPWLKPVWSGLNGSQIFNAESLQYTLDSEENVEWLTYWLNWLDEQYQGDIEQLNFYGPYDGAYAPGAFNSGFAAMVQSGSWATSDAEMPFNWEIAKFPVGPSGERSVTGYWPNWWIVPAGAADIQESFLFCEYFCTKGWETWYSYIMDTPAWVNFPDGVLTEKLVEEVGLERATEIHNFFSDYLNDTVDMWNSPVENFANDTLETAVSEVLFKQTTPDQALASAQELIQARLDETLQA